MTPSDWIGRSHERMGARDRVTGALRYTADLSFDDVLHVKLVQVGGARSTIKKIDRSAALKVPGVECVLIADDLPKPIPRWRGLRNLNPGNRIVFCWISTSRIWMVSRFWAG